VDCSVFSRPEGNFLNAGVLLVLVREWTNGIPLNWPSTRRYPDYRSDSLHEASLQVLTFLFKKAERRFHHRQGITVEY
jgi:hypothetical protein